MAETHPKRCNAPLHYRGSEYLCSMAEGHPGRHRTWVEQGDEEAEFDRDYDAEEREQLRERLGWR